jgi:hypothetical protein
VSLIEADNHGHVSVCVDVRAPVELTLKQVRALSELLNEVSGFFTPGLCGQAQLHRLLIIAKAFTLAYRSEKEGYVEVRFVDSFA